MKKIVFLICLIFCSFQQIKNNNNNSLIINFDSLKETELFASMFFNAPTTIILETSKKCMIGSVSDMQVFDGKIYIFDKMNAKSLFQFDLNGKYIGKIGEYGRGPGEYLRLMDFTIDKKNNELYLLDYDKLHRYKTDGTYLNTVNIEIRNASVQSIQFFNEMIYAEVLPFPSNKYDIDLLWRFNPLTGKKIDSFLKSSEYTYGWSESISLGYKHFFACLDESPLYAHYLMNTVISLDNMMPIIKIESKNLLSKKIIDQVSSEQENHLRIEKLLNINRLFCIHDYVETQRFVFFSYLYSYSKTGCVFHDFYNNQSYHFKYLKNDLLFKDGSMRSKFGFYDSVGAYMILDAYEVLEEFEKNNMLSNIDKKENLMKIDEESNPIILYYEFK